MRAVGWQERGMLAGVNNLCVLDLYRCRIKRVPEAILNLSTLTWLGLEDNKLMMLPVFCKGQRLQVVGGCGGVGR